MKGGEEEDREMEIDGNYYLHLAHLCKGGIIVKAVSASLEVNA